MEHGLVHKNAINMRLLKDIVTSSLAKNWVHNQNIFLDIFYRLLLFVDKRSNIWKKGVFVSNPFVSLVLFNNLPQFIELHLLELQSVYFCYDFKTIRHLTVKNLRILLLFCGQKPIIEWYLLL